MPARPDLTELERIATRGLDHLTYGEWASVADALQFLLADARKVETLTEERDKLRSDLRYLAEWDETKAAVLGSSDFRLIARAALEGASDE